MFKIVDETLYSAGSIASLSKRVLHCVMVHDPSVAIYVPHIPSNILTEKWLEQHMVHQIREAYTQVFQELVWPQRPESRIRRQEDKIAIWPARKKGIKKQENLTRDKHNETLEAGYSNVACDERQNRNPASENIRGWFRGEWKGH